MYSAGRTHIPGSAAALPLFATPAALAGATATAAAAVQAPSLPPADASAPTASGDAFHLEASFLPLKTPRAAASRRRVERLVLQIDDWRQLELFPKDPEKPVARETAAAPPPKRALALEALSRSELPGIPADAFIVPPPFRWPGNKWSGRDRKADLAPVVAELLGRQIGGTIHEPFSGTAGFTRYVFAGGLLATGSIHHLYDENRGLMTLLWVLRDREGAARLPRELSHERYEPSQEAYDRIREEYRSRQRRAAGAEVFGGDPAERVREAADLWYLMQYGYGVYREGPGGFNVPRRADAERVTLVRPQAIDAWHRFLQGVRIFWGDFSAVLDHAEPGDLVVFDPPYLPEIDDTRRSGCKTALRYTARGFGMFDQWRLAQTARALDARGIRFVLHNSNAPEVEVLYQGFDTRVVTVPRQVGRNKGRGEAEEVIVRNF